MAKPFSGNELTARVNHQLEIARLQNSLNEQKSRLQSIFDNAADAIITLDTNSQVESLNNAGKQLFGWSAVEMVGRNIKFLIPGFKLDLSDESKNSQVILKESNFMGSATRFEGKHQDGSILQLEISVSNTFLEDCDLLIILLRDISRLVETESQLSQQQKRLETVVKEQDVELENSSKWLSSFTWSTSHDLQEPLRKITSFSKMLQDDYAENLDQQGNHYLQRIIDLTWRMRKLVESQLNFPQLEDPEHSILSVDLNIVIQQVLEDLELLIKDTGAVITHNTLPGLKGNMLQIKQTFYNLILNALTFVNNNEPPKIYIHTRKSIGDVWTISVQNNGIGFDNDFREEIFTPYRRLHGESNYPGIGMGLAFCRKVVERHGWKIDAKSKLGQGSIFSIHLLDRRKK